MNHSVVQFLFQKETFHNIGQKLHQSRCQSFLVLFHFPCFFLLFPKYFIQYCRRHPFTFTLPQRKGRTLFIKRVTAWKVSECGVFSDPYFPIFGLNQKWVKKIPELGHPLCSAWLKTNVYSVTDSIMSDVIANLCNVL